jgi:hypothetical protein
MVCIWLHIAAHADRSPRLTLKAGRKEGYKAGPTAKPPAMTTLYILQLYANGDSAITTNPYGRY